KPCAASVLTRSTCFGARSGRSLMTTLPVFSSMTRLSPAAYAGWPARHVVSNTETSTRDKIRTMTLLMMLWGEISKAGEADLSLRGECRGPYGDVTTTPQVGGGLRICR